MRTAQKAYHRGFRELECISKGFHRAWHCNKNPLKGLSSYIVRPLLCETVECFPMKTS
jgi:hypothetical protein